MNIIYPPLVEESIKFQLLEKKQSFISKADTYRFMVENDIITENGEPTDFAIEKGWVKIFDETENLSLENFLKIYPIFEKYDVGLLEKIDGYWEIPIDLKEKLLLEMAEDKFNYDEQVQLTEYLSSR
ncbi:hypothetical protein A5819_001567 [Enterococcus sp. 7E2_DIV0204]|uniref:Uncharacterized protein n=1 Tax=Candidatus Enterococcus lemimoniae TaxID=1834167 RepID=A0ABZ2T650_9ENTE|nr:MULTISPECIES: hypothetical protein [unclassified Enterococcus]OTN89075.1 hypothetical protein A5819_001567 [Enterococcus sp. 7E2_DIV0204]OTO65712.1 hypothetical protein A5866_003398 [Enterococcus sp. 12C11_DIV0727]OTP51530.1 hypothetical protein A5884_000725 [Enterococcus sp. 7D2_DIV0200]